MNRLFLFLGLFALALPAAGQVRPPQDRQDLLAPRPEKPVTRARPENIRPLHAGRNAIARKTGSSLSLEFTGMAGSGNLSAIDAASDVTCSGGALYVIGAGQMPGTSFDWILQRYRPDGTEDWTLRFDGESEADDAGYFVAPGPQGSVYAVGITVAALTQIDILVMRVSHTGEILWQTHYDGPHHGHDVPNAVATDAAGALIVAGISHRTPSLGDDFAMLTLKIGTNGAIEWANREDATTGEAYGVATGPNGEVAVTGTTVRPTSDPSLWSFDFATVVYDTEGARRWEAYHAGPEGSMGSDDRGHRVAFTPDGGVIATGPTSSPSNSFNNLTIAYDAAGTRLWTDTYNGITDLDDIAYGIIPLRDGAVVCGTTHAAAEGWFAIRYDLTGTRIWTVAEPNTVHVAGCADSGSGTFYMAGDQADPNLNWNIVTGEFRMEDGTALWTRVLDLGDDDQAFALTVHDGRLVTAGRTWAENTDYDLLLFHTASTGTPTWHASWGGAGESNDHAVDAAFGPDGSTFLAAWSERPHGKDLMTARFDPEGNAQWAALDRPRQNSSPYAVATNSDGRSATAGVTYVGDGAPSYAAPVVAVRSAEGDPLGTAVEDQGQAAWYTDVMFAPEGHVVTAGTRMTVMRFDHSGVRDWTYAHPGATEGPWDVSLIRSTIWGQMYLVGHVSHTPTIVLLTRDGDLVWELPLPLSGAHFVRPQAAAVGPDGELIAAYLQQDGGGRRSWFVFAVDTDGNLKWSETFRTGQGELDIPSSVVVDPSGRIYVAGGSRDEVTGSDLRQHVVKVWEADGTPVWEWRSDDLYPAMGPDLNAEYGPQLALGHDCTLYLAGTAYTPDLLAHELVLLRLTGAGMESGLLYGAPNGYSMVPVGVSAGPEKGRIRVASIRGYKHWSGAWLRGVASTQVFHDSAVLLANETLHPTRPDDIQIWPVPVKAGTPLNVSGSGPVRIYDPLGRLVGSARSGPIDTAAFARGTYVIEVAGTRRAFVVN